MAQPSGDKETIIEVPLEYTAHPLGFVIDAGGSVTKVIYRSREDFSGGKPIKQSKSGYGRLRLRYANMGKHDEVLEFLKNNCDISINRNKDDDETIFWMTGITTQHFKSELEQTFNVKTKLFSEMTALGICLKNAKGLGLSCYQPSQFIATEGKKAVEMTLLIMKRNPLPPEMPNTQETNTRSDKDNNGQPGVESANAALKSAAGSSHPPANLQGTPAMDLMTIPNPLDWLKKHMDYKGSLEAPALLILVGSAASVSLVDENFNTKEIDFTTISGKTFCALAEEMTGVRDFDVLMEMAERGKIENVDASLRDISSSNHKEDDWYDTLPGDFLAFQMGKLSSCSMKGKGTYSKDDIVTGLLYTVSNGLSKLLILNAKLHKVQRVYVSGSLFKKQVARSALERYFAVEAVFYNLSGGPYVKLFFIENPGFLVASGVWCKNLEEEKTRNEKN